MQANVSLIMEKLVTGSMDQGAGIAGRLVSVFSLSECIFQNNIRHNIHFVPC